MVILVRSSVKLFDGEFIAVLFRKNFNFQTSVR